MDPNHDTEESNGTNGENMPECSQGSNGTNSDNDNNQDTESSKMMDCIQNVDGEWYSNLDNSSEISNETLMGALGNIAGDKKKREFQCPVPWCGKIFKRPDRLKKHFLIHTNDRQYVCCISYCKKSYTTAQHLKRHMQLAHTDHEPNPDPVQCTYEGCTKSFATPYGLKKHFENYHVNRKSRFFCEHCSTRFMCLSELNTHLLSVHNIKSITCDKCDKVFTTNHQKNRHMRGHRTFRCEEPGCEDLVFEKYNEKRTHDSIVHPSVYYCQDCDFKTNRKLFLQEHMHKHLPDWARPMFRCTYGTCSRTFCHMRNFARHVKIRHGPVEIRYPCTLGCPQTFSTKQSFQRHKRIIHDNKAPGEYINPADLPFPCKSEKCPKRFGTAHKAHRHFLFYHKDERPGARKLAISGFNEKAGVSIEPVAHEYSKERLKNLVNQQNTHDNIPLLGGCHFLADAINMPLEEFSKIIEKNSLHKTGENSTLLKDALSTVNQVDTAVDQSLNNGDFDMDTLKLENENTCES